MKQLIKDMDAVFSRFDSYDFDADQRFQDGLKTLKSGDETKVLDMKLFFYNRDHFLGAVVTPPLIVRFVEPIDRGSYKQQSSADAKVMDQAVFSHASGEGTQLSFAEVMQLVQEGKEVPGVTKMDVKPTNQSPTPSQMERMQKPWEISSASE